MKIKFDSTLEYQQDAINAAVRVFDGQPSAHSHLAINMADETGLQLTSLGAANHITLDDAQILANVRKVQAANDIKKVDALQADEAQARGYQFSIEMETGTGKTYIYLRTIFELYKHYGFKKFIIVVPSVAIREGVLKSIDMMKVHLGELYNRAPFNHFVYDSKKLERVRDFATSGKLQIMVINIQSFQKDVTDQDTTTMSEEELKKLNVINRESEKMSGRKPIEFIQAAKPILIIDEPQSVDSTDKAKNAIANLHPLATFRYSATHRESYNLLYRLDPIRAYDLRLVKQIEVASIRVDGNFKETYVKLMETRWSRGTIQARVQIYAKGSGGAQLKDMWIKQDDNLFDKSDKYEEYREGYIVTTVDRTPGTEHIVLSNGKRLFIGDSIGETGDAVMKAQVHATVVQHLRKEGMLKSRGIKVLSLFFIDKVENYRVYSDDGTTTLGKIGQWFEDAYRELTQESANAQFAVQDLSTIHNGYFSQDSKGRAKNTKGASAADGDTYNLIMRDKEKLLDMNEPLRFVFSHSALREGWDNPNVFQICTLNESRSHDKKRQEIGRGLRLPVNQKGERVQDDNINRLTVIANESYEAFASSLQTEFEEDCGIKFGYVADIAFAKITRAQADGSEAEIGQDESKKIWGALKADGYIDDEGKILPKFNPQNLTALLNALDAYEDIRAQIVEVLTRHQPRIRNVRDRKEVKFKKEVLLDEEFKQLWDKIKFRTRYRVTFDSGELIAKAAQLIREDEQIQGIEPTQIHMTRRVVKLSEAGVEAGEGNLEHRRYETPTVRVLPDILTHLQDETELTRRTLAKILLSCERLEKFLINPQQFMSLVVKKIHQALRGFMVDGIEYEKIPDHCWQAQRISEEAEKGIIRYLDNLYKLQERQPPRSLFDHVEYDSTVEKQFAVDLDSHEFVRFFVKLPRWFTIDTPLGTYNPDWAFVTERNEKLYFVRETKSTLDSVERKTTENQKIECGKSHFKTIGVDYGIVTKLSEVDF